MNKSGYFSLLKENFTSRVSENEIIYDLIIDDNILLNVCSDKKSGEIKLIELTSEKYDDSFIQTVDKIISVISIENESEREKLYGNLSDSISKGNGGFTIQSAVFDDKTYNLINLSAGCKFSIIYNEEIPTQTTVTPETDYEYKYHTVEDTTAP